nr:hypothetical protein CFP56_69574 [Quercus suber]
MTPATHAWQFAWWSVEIHDFPQPRLVTCLGNDPETIVATHDDAHDLTDPAHRRCIILPCHLKMSAGSQERRGRWRKEDHPSRYNELCEWAVAVVGVVSKACRSWWHAHDRPAGKNGVMRRRNCTSSFVDLGRLAEGLCYC